ncbi:MAG: hypothetical protein SF069_13540 [Phycisphaerae bacterium]|nr:hypothetical protein [Phycisphaerae bacterium]
MIFAIFFWILLAVLLVGVLYARTGLQTILEAVAFSLASGLVLAPVLLDVLWRFTNSRGALVAMLVLPYVLRTVWRHFLADERAGTPRSSTREPQALSRQGSLPRMGLIGISLWVGGCVFASFALPEWRGPVAPRAAQDYVKHHAIMMALETGPLPLRSPFYAAAPDEPYYYYHYAYLWPAALRILSFGTIPISVAFGLHSALVAVAFILLIFVIARRLTGSDGRALFAAACASIIGGWDVIPIAFQVLSQGRAIPAIFDSWIPSPWRIHNLGTQFLWCPQHVHALLTLTLVGEWLARMPHSRAWLALGPLFAASIFGSSAFVSLTAFPAAAILALRSLAPQQPTGSEGIAIIRRFAALLWIAVASLALMMLQLPGYLEMGRRIGGGFTTAWDRLPVAILGRLAPPGVIANWLDAPWILFIDLGIVAVALAALAMGPARRFVRDPVLLLLLLAGGMGAIGTFTLHDRAHEFVYGFRVCVMALSAAGAIAAAFLWPANRSARLAKIGIVYAVLLGLPVGLLELPLMASRALLRAAPLEADRGALTWIRANTPPNAVVQGDPISRFETVQLIDRRAAVLDPDNAHVQVFTPRDLPAMRAARDAARALFTSNDAAAIESTIRRLRVEYLLVGSAERALCGECSIFDTLASLEIAYRDDAARVYRVRPESAKIEE